MVRIYYDAFDSEMLNRDCYKIHISDADNISNVNDLTDVLRNTDKADSYFLFTEHNSILINKITELGFELISTRNVYEINSLESLLIKPPTVPNVLYKKDIRVNFSIENFTSLIHSLVQKSRYWKDNNIPKELSIKVYQNWFLNSIYGDFADEVIVLLEDNRILGLITLKRRDGTGFIDLIVVDENAKGRGYGKRLLHESATYFLSQKIKTIKVETEGENIEANRFYQKNGFLLFSHSLIFHHHISK